MVILAGRTRFFWFNTLNCNLSNSMHFDTSWVSMHLYMNRFRDRCIRAGCRWFDGRCLLAGIGCPGRLTAVGTDTPSCIPSSHWRIFLAGSTVPYYMAHFQKCTTPTTVRMIDTLECWIYSYLKQTTTFGFSIQVVRKVSVQFRLLIKCMMAHLLTLQD